MSVALKYDIVSTPDYLAFEETSPERHELVGGVLYAMAGESWDHNEIAQNMQVAIRDHVRRGGCQTYINGVKLYIPLAGDSFYYPDVMVACDPRDNDRRFIRYPKLLIEVLSESTQQTDRREKLFAYLQIETLEEYILVSSLTREVVIHRRSEGWAPRRLPIEATELHLASLDLTIPVERIYEGAVFPAIVATGEKA